MLLSDSLEGSMQQGQRANNKDGSRVILGFIPKEGLAVVGKSRKFVLGFLIN